MFKLFQKINLPNLPSALVNTALRTGIDNCLNLKTRQQITGYNGKLNLGYCPTLTTVTKIPHVDPSKGLYVRNDASDDIKKFIHDVIPEEFNIENRNIGIHTIINDFKPNVSKNTNKLIYRLNKNSVDMTWFKEIGKDLIRDDRGQATEELDKLIKVTSGTLHINNWYLLTTNVYHGIINNDSDEFIVDLVINLNTWQAFQLAAEFGEVPMIVNSTS